jgi:hypothetical protein
MLAFVHIYKSAGTTMKGILRRNFGARHFETGLLRDTRNLSAAQLHRIRWIYPRLMSIAGHEVRPFADLRKECPDIRFYTFLRRPKARLVSAFRTKAANRIAHEGWQPAAADIETAFLAFADLQRRKTCRVFAPDGDLARAREALERDVGFVGLVEKFDESMGRFRDWTGLPDFDVGYRTLNVGAARAEADAQHRFRPFGAQIAAADEMIKELAARPDVVERLDEIAEPDQAFYDFAQARFAERSRAPRELSPASRKPRATEAFSARLHRFALARPLVPLLARSAPPFTEDATPLD